MAHKTLIDGTAYEIKGGRDLIGGTGYAKKKGRVLVNGTGYDIPFSKGVPLNTITPGAILYLNESGSPVPFYIAKHDYESGLNGAGRTLLVRKDCYDTQQFNMSGNKYANSHLDSWLNNTWLKLLDSSILPVISKTSFYYTPGGDNESLSTLQRAVFLMSIKELGGKINNSNDEGIELPISGALRIAYLHNNKVNQWTRTPLVYAGMPTSYFFCFNTAGTPERKKSSEFNGSRPAFTLPGTLALAQNADGTYSIAT